MIDRLCSSRAVEGEPSHRSVHCSSQGYSNRNSNATIPSTKHINSTQCTSFITRSTSSSSKGPCTTFANPTPHNQPQNLNNATSSWATNYWRARFIPYHLLLVSYFLPISFATSDNYFRIVCTLHVTRLFRWKQRLAGLEDHWCYSSLERYEVDS